MSLSFNTQSVTNRHGKELSTIIGLLLLFTNVHATVLRVPTFYSTIATAITASQPNDTILITPGFYAGGVAIPHNLTIASLFMFNRDTAIRDNSIWQTDTNRITISNHSLRLLGIHFRASGEPLCRAGILTGNGVSITVESCIIDGTYDAAPNISSAIFFLAAENHSTFLMKECHYRNDSLGAVALLRADNCTTILERCDFVGRRFSGLPWLHTGGGLLTLRNSIIRLDGEGMFIGDDYLIESTKFFDMGSRGMYLSPHSPASLQVIRNCSFDSAVHSPPDMARIIRSWGNDCRTIFEHCTFSRSYNGDFPYLDMNGVVSFRNCIFSENQHKLLTADKFVIDSCLFRENSSPLFIRSSNMYYDSVRISNSDFIGNSIHFTTRIDETIDFDTILAPHCYWGDPTGPNHPLNPNGLGQLLPAFVNPFPFRTTPVFPVDGISDPGNRVTYTLPLSPQFTLFPNPMNATTSIRFTVPSATPMHCELYDRTGRLVSGFTIDQKNVAHGQYPLQFMSTPSGLYFVRLSSSQASATQPLVIVK